MKKFLFFFLFLILVSSLCYATDFTISTLIFNETFNYTYNYSVNGWDDFTTGSLKSYANWTTAPYNFSYIGLSEAAFGWNSSNGSGVSQRMQIKQNSIWNHDYLNDTSNKYYITFDYWENEASPINAGAYDFDIIMTTATANNKFFNFQLDEDHNWDINNYFGDDCTQITPSANNAEHEFILELDYPNSVYTLYIDGSAVVGCEEIALTTPPAGYYTDGISLMLRADSIQDPTPSIQQYIDNIYIFEGEIGLSVTTCSEPLIFCDDFNYNASMYTTKDWIVYNADNSLNTGFRPNQSSVRMLKTNPKTIGHEIDRFTVSYPESEGISTIASLYAPVFTNEFDIYFTNDSYHDVRFNTFDLDYDACFNLRFYRNNRNSTISVQFYNLSDEWSTLGGISVNNNHTVKIISKFSHNNKTLPFNTSFEKNFLELYIDDAAFHSVSNTDFDDTCKNIFNPFIVKENISSNITIDNYYMYVGTDPNIDTLDFYTVPLYDNSTEVETAVESGDLSDAVDSIWDDMGLKTQASKIILSLMILIIVTLVVIGSCIINGFPYIMGATATVNILLMIMLVYLGLMPVWIIIVLVLLASGLGVIYLKSHIT